MTRIAARCERCLGDGRAATPSGLSRFAAHRFARHAAIAYSCAREHLPAAIIGFLAGLKATVWACLQLGRGSADGARSCNSLRYYEARALFYAPHLFNENGVPAGYADDPDSHREEVAYVANCFTIASGSPR
jgi:hypothetical protein